MSLKCSKLLFITLLFILSICTNVSATHFAYGTISWIYTGSGESYKFNFESAWRTDYGWNEGTPSTTPGARGNSIYIGQVTFNAIGSGSSASSWNVYTTVVSIQPNDWFIGTTSTTITFPSQQTGWNYAFQMCCRLSTIQQNNHDSNTRLSGSLTVGSRANRYTSSPTATTFPRSLFNLGQPINYRIPGFSPQGNQLSFTTVQSYSANGLTTNPIASIGNNPGASVNAQTGQVTWTAPTCCNGYLYALQFTITDTVTQSSIVLDELFQLVTQCTAGTPGCVSPPYFSPPIPATYSFYIGQQQSYTIRAVDDTPGETITVFSTPLPSGATFSQTSSGNSVATYALTWSPALGQNGAVVCFSAFNSENPQQQSTGNNCANMIIAQAYILVVSCIIRDFGPTTPDFNKGASGDIGTPFVSTTLTGSGPPVFTGTATTTSAASFPNWWNTNAVGYAGSMAWSMVLTSPTLAGPYTFSQPQFYPIDGLIGGNEAGSAHNHFYSLEGHTYISLAAPTTAYTAPPTSTNSPNTLVFYATDDFYLYINGYLAPSSGFAPGPWNLGGINSAAFGKGNQATINFDALIYNAQTSKSNPYNLRYDDAGHNFPTRIDFFYADRSNFNDAALYMQLFPSYLCNALSKGFVVVDASTGFTSASTAQFATLGTAAAGTNYLSLLNSAKNPQSNSGAFWFQGSGTTPVPQKVLYGFEVDFAFQFMGSSEGFALVLQASGPNAIGTAFGGLGYNQMSNSLAIEFDAQQSSQFNDPAPYACSQGATTKCTSHVAIHTQYSGLNSATEATPLPQIGIYTLSSSNVPFMNFVNQSVHYVKVVYTPPDPNSGATAGWVKVYMGSTNDGAAFNSQFSAYSLLPVAQGQLNTASLASAWGGAAYVGFTTGSSSTNYADIQIQSFKLTVVQAVAGNSVPIQLPSSITAGDTGTFNIQLKDACNNKITSGGDTAAFTVTLSSSTVTNIPAGLTAISDNGDGTYAVSYKPTTAGVYSILVTYKGQGVAAAPINSAPWSFTVYPGPASPLTSTFQITDVNLNVIGVNAATNTHAVNTNAASFVRITGIDAFGNLATRTTDPFSVIFAPTINVTSPPPVDNAAGRGVGYYITPWSTGVAGAYSLYVTLNSQQLASSPMAISVLAGAAYAPQCTSSATGSGLTQTVAGATGTFVITLRDSAGNLILAPGNPTDVACQTVANGCTLVFQGTQPPAPAQAAGAPPVTCSWVAAAFTCSYTAYIAGPYSFNVKINGLAMTAFPTAVSIIPGNVVGANCLAIGNVVSGSTVTVTAGVQVTGLFIQAKDQYYNLRTTPNDSNGVFTVSFSSTTNLVTPSKANPTPVYLNNGQYSIVFQTNTATTAANPLTLTITYQAASSGPISGSPLTVNVNPAAPDTPSTLSSTTATATVAANTGSGTLSLSSIDQFNNARNNLGDQNLFTLVWSQNGQVVPKFMTAITFNSANNYNVAYGYTVTGTYTVSAQVTASGHAVTYSPNPITITLLPGPTSTPNCLPYGSGLVSAISGQSNSFFVQARDLFNNYENAGTEQTTDTFYATVNGGTQQFTSTPNGAGLYTINYLAPTGTTGSTFTVTVFRSGTGAGQINVYTVTLARGGNTLYAKISSNSAVDGVATSFIVTEYTSIACTTTYPGGVSLSVNIFHSSGVQLPGVSVSNENKDAGGNPLGTFTVTFTPQLTLPVGGQWYVNVTRGTVNAQSSVPYPFLYSITAGPVANGNIVSLPTNPACSNNPYTATLQLVDAFNNPAGAGATGATVTASFSVTSLTTTTFTASGTYSAATGLWSFSFPVKVAAPYTVSFSYVAGTAAAVPVGSGTFTAVAGPPSLTKSTIVGDGITANTLLTLYAHNVGPFSNSTYKVTLYDDFGNLIDTSGTGNSVTVGITFTPTLSQNKNFVSSTTYLGFSVFSGFIQSDLAGQFTLTIGLSSGGTLLGNLAAGGSSTYNVIILPGALSASASTVYVTSPVPAGSSVTATVTATDAYGNPWTGAFLAVLRDSNGAPTNAMVTAGAAGSYTATVAGGMATGMVGTHNFQFTANGISVTLTPSTTPPTGAVGGATLTVNAGPVYPPNTVVPAALNTTLVGQSQSFTITLRDAYGNVISNPSPTPALSIQYLQGRINCAAHDEVGTNQLILTPVNQNCNGNPLCPLIGTTTPFTLTGVPGQYSVAFTPKAIGTFTLNLTVGNYYPQTLPCSSLVQLTVVTTPGVPDPTQSFITGLPVSAVANQLTKLTVHLRDSFGNPISIGGSSLALGSVPASSTASPVTLTNNFVDNGDGSYSFAVSPQKTGSWFVPVVITSSAAPTTLISCVAGSGNSAVLPNQAPNGNPCQYVVTPAQAWAWNVIYPSLNPNPPLRAADPNKFVLQMTDAYNNNVGLLNASLTIVSSNQAVASYPIPGTLIDLGSSGLGPAGQYEYDYFTLLSGVTNFQITFNPNTSPACANSPATPYLCPEGTCTASPGTCQTPPKSTAYTLTIAGAVCGPDANGNPQYRCGDGTCVADATKCADANACPNNGVRSSQDGQCYAPGTLPCAGTVCPGTNVCVPTGGSCLTPLPCPAGLIKCPSGSPYASAVCRSDISQCPSARVCPPNAKMCPDNMLCVNLTATCPTSSASTCPTGKSACWNGACVSAFEDCPTAKTCPSVRPFVCPDGSCQASASACPSLLPCYNSPFTLGSSVSCPDGTCVSSYSNCPSQVTCPVGWVLCENNRCAQNLAACPTNNACGNGYFRCGDGSCRPNSYFCPTAKTCPASAPVLCGDGTCSTSNSFCTAPQSCNLATGSLYTCPDGSCASGLASCATTTTCPLSTPVLCPDGSCVQNSAGCAAHTVSACPAALSFRCPDGSCRNTLIDCPTRSSCSNPNLPVRCSNGQCVESNQQCPNGNTITCPVVGGNQYVRCPFGGCALTYDLCPTPITCPVGAARCGDGSCRATCDPLTTIAPTCPPNLPYSCPVPTGGVVCVSSSSQCPSFPVCPAATPVKCLDSTCASSVGTCPPVPTAPVAGHVPCPDGSWSTSFFLCPTPTTCPMNYPFKCWDGSCRLVPDDCPAAASCPAATPYRCATGYCGATPWDTQCISTLTSCYGDPNGPVNCYNGASNANPYLGTPSTCVSDSTQCSGTPSTALGCAGSQTRCRDGSCRLSNPGIATSVCADTAIQCSASFPILCSSGQCVQLNSQCPAIGSAFSNVCGPNAYQCLALGGACVQNATSCPASSQAQCPAGSTFCVSTASCQAAGSICPTTNPCTLVCSDGTCITAAAPVGGWNATNSPCNAVSGSPDVCYPPTPFRCSSGFCAVSSVDCPSTPSAGACNQPTPFQCANGLCVQDSSQCPVVLSTCASGLSRCGDGSCRQTCTNINTCPNYPSTNVAPLPTGPRAVCPNGLCPLNDGTCLCTDTTTNGCISVGCPPNQQRCPSGQCIAASASCSTSNAAPGTLVPASNGCPISGNASVTPVKCPDGTCQPDISLCVKPNGCPYNAPIRCTSSSTGGTGSNICVADQATCTGPPSTATPQTQCADGTYASNGVCNALNGCPIKTPVRCADGQCKKFPATAFGLPGVTPCTAGQPQSGDVCCPTLTCTAPLFRCFDGTCVSSLSFCPAVPACPGNQVACPNSLVCVSSLSACPAGKCAPNVPVLCPDGACVSSLTLCPAPVSPGASIGGSTGNTQVIPNSVTNVPGSTPQSTVPTGTPPTGDTAIPPSGTGVSTNVPPVVSRCASPLVECFDGSCRSSTAACIGFSQSTAANGASCESQNLVTCGDGSCMPSPLLCPIIKACPPTAPVRCPNGACIVGQSTLDCTGVTTANQISLSQCDWGVGYTPRFTWRCEDGTCRPNCLPADGCPTSAPVLCSNRECAKSHSQCPQVNGNGFVPNNGFVYDPLLLTPRSGMNAPTSSPTVGPISYNWNSLFRRLLSTDNDLPLIDDFVDMAISGSTGSAGPAPTVSPTANSSIPTVSTIPSTCYSNCYAQVKATAGSYLLPIGQASQIPVAVSSGSTLGLLIVPSASLTTNAQGVSSLSVSVFPVGESVVLNAENRVWSGRRGDVGASYLTFAESVLSPMVNISFDTNAIKPLPVNVTLKLAVDQTRTGAGPNNNYPDICLAQLIQIPLYGYSAWQCLGDVGSVSHSVGDPNYLLQASLGDNGIYAMIYVPHYVPAPPPPIAWALANIGWLILILIGGIAFIFGVLYAITRLTRYRSKYHEERAAVKKQQEEVDEMEQFGGTAGTKDDEVEMQSNPMVVQMKDMQARLDKKNEEMRKIEQQQKSQESAVRQDHINALKSDRDQMMAELEKLKKELAAQAKAQPVGPRHNSMAPANQVANPYGAPTSRPQASYETGPTETQQQRQEFQAARPKARKGID